MVQVAALIDPRMLVEIEAVAYRRRSVRLVAHTPPLVTVPNLTLRAWQKAALERMSAWQEGPFLLSAAPGAGKTIPSLVYARGLLRRRDRDAACTSSARRRR